MDDLGGDELALVVHVLRHVPNISPHLVNFMHANALNVLHGHGLIVVPSVLHVLHRVAVARRLFARTHISNNRLFRTLRPIRVQEANTM